MKKHTGIFDTDMRFTYIHLFLNRRRETFKILTAATMSAATKFTEKLNAVPTRFSCIWADT